MTRAPTADRTGHVVRDGVRIGVRVHENDAPTILLLPTWAIVHSGAWEAQIRHLARRWRVVVFDGRGNGASDRPDTPEAYSDEEHVRDALAVLDATGTDRAVCAGWSRGGKWAALLAAEHPARVLGLFLIAPGIPYTPHPTLTAERFLADVDEPSGWDTFNLARWLDGGWEDFLRFFHSQVFPEPGCEAEIAQALEWSLETTPETIARTMGSRLGSQAGVEAAVASVRCPVRVLHARGDRINPYAWGARTAELTGGELLTLEGDGHAPNVTDPACVNGLLDEFVSRVTAGGARRG